ALLPFVWGVAMIVGGFGKVQMAFDLKRMQDSRWWILFIGAAVSFVLGIFSVTRPLFIATIATQFMGVSLLVEAALDAASIIAFRRQIKKAFPQGMGSVK
ncbi:MAG: DUF308 domain-containing protein, partial [Eubacteriales bacterium]|nr:DUF308 domain-containing protein [Eubacteriales bacterium]